MFRLTGEFDCKADAKGRVKLPSALIRQLGEGVRSYTINRGFEKHLMLYPREVWEQKTNEIDQLNIYSAKHRQVIRYFYRGATEIILDGSDRMLIPRSLMDFAEINKEIVLFAYRDHIEVWAKDKYESMIDDEPEDFSAIADEIFGGSAAD
ncbi:MAG: division/cell wall cluster transcriptional repressor MraZ [Bacteroidota bacterium]